MFPGQTRDGPGPSPHRQRLRARLDGLALMTLGARPALVGMIMVALGLVPLLTLTAIRATRTDTPSALEQPQSTEMATA